MTATVVSTPRPEHSAQRNWRMEPVESSTSAFAFPDGSELKIVSHSSEHSVSERFCEPCDQWVATEGVLGGVWCPKCGIEWTRNKKDNQG